MSSYKIIQCNIINISILNAYQDLSCRIYFYSYCNSKLNFKHADYHSPIGGRCWQKQLQTRPGCLGYRKKRRIYGLIYSKAVEDNTVKLRVLCSKDDITNRKQKPIFKMRQCLLDSTELICCTTSKLCLSWAEPEMEKQSPVMHFPLQPCSKHWRNVLCYLKLFTKGQTLSRTQRLRGEKSAACKWKVSSSNPDTGTKPLLTNRRKRMGDTFFIV